MRNIFFVGMMGSGKTTTAIEFAKAKEIQAVDCDQLIEAEKGQSVAQIFEKEGEAVFRDLEKKVLNRIAVQKDQIIATGGGVVLAPENIKLMRAEGTVIYLKTSFPVLWERVQHSKARPLLKSESPEKTFRSIFNTRTPLYERAAHHVVLTDGKTPKQVAEEINKEFFR